MSEQDSYIYLNIKEEQDLQIKQNLIQNLQPFRYEPDTNSDQSYLSYKKNSNYLRLVLEGQQFIFLTSSEEQRNRPASAFTTNNNVSRPNSIGRITPSSTIPQQTHTNMTEVQQRLLQVQNSQRGSQFTASTDGQAVNNVSAEQAQARNQNFTVDQDQNRYSNNQQQSRSSQMQSEDDISQQHGQSNSPSPINRGSAKKTSKRPIDKKRVKSPPNARNNHLRDVSRSKSPNHAQNTANTANTVQAQNHTTADQAPQNVDIFSFQGSQQDPQSNEYGYQTGVPHSRMGPRYITPKRKRSRSPIPQRQQSRVPQNQEQARERRSRTPEWRNSSNQRRNRNNSSDDEDISQIQVSQEINQSLNERSRIDQFGQTQTTLFDNTENYDREVLIYCMNNGIITTFRRYKIKLNDNNMFIIGRIYDFQKHNEIIKKEQEKIIRINSSNKKYIYQLRQLYDRRLRIID